MSHELGPSSSHSSSSPETPGTEYEPYTDSESELGLDTESPSTDTDLPDQESDTTGTPEEGAGELSEGAPELEETPEEAAAHEELQESEQLQTATDEEKEYRLTRIDKLLNTKDRVQKKALLYDQRDRALQWNIARLEGKYAKMRSGSHRAKRLENKIALMKRTQGAIRRNANALTSRIEGRGPAREQMINGGTAADQLKKDMRDIGIVAKEEKKRRKQLSKEFKSTESEMRRSALKAEIKSWEKNTLPVFYEKLVQEAMSNFRKRKAGEEIEQERQAA